MKRFQLSLLLLVPGVSGFVTAQTPQPAAQQEPAAQAPGGDQPNSGGVYVYKVGGAVTNPKLIHYADPKYTREAKKKRIEGICVLSMIVGTDGVPHDIKVIRSIAEKVEPKLQSAAAGLDETAVETAQQFRFQPSTYNGKPVPVVIHLEVNYHLYSK